jgi:hypothetical protein
VRLQTPHVAFDRGKKEWEGRKRALRFVVQVTVGGL